MSEDTIEAQVAALRVKAKRRAAQRARERAALPDSHKSWLDVAEAEVVMSRSGMSIKNLCRNGKLVANKIRFSNGITKWLIQPESAEAYQTTSKGRTGYRRLVLRVNTDVYDPDEVIALLTHTYHNEDAQGRPGLTCKYPKPSKSTKKNGDSGKRIDPSQFVAEILAPRQTVSKELIEESKSTN